jgi:Cu/Ag efflux protein CusF
MISKEIKNKFLPFVSTLLLALLLSCQQNPSQTQVNQTNKSITSVTPAPTSPTFSPTIAPTVAAVSNSSPQKVEPKYYDGTGTITKINLEIGSVELDHEEIKGLMPEMIMEFYVRDQKQLKALQVGDKVDFVLEDKAGQEMIFSIKKQRRKQK